MPFFPKLHETLEHAFEYQGAAAPECARTDLASKTHYQQRQIFSGSKKKKQVDDTLQLNAESEDHNESKQSLDPNETRGDGPKYP
jgi:hypothetical protein